MEEIGMSGTTFTKNPCASSALPTINARLRSTVSIIEHSTSWYYWFFTIASEPAKRIWPSAVDGEISRTKLSATLESSPG